MLGGDANGFPNGRRLQDDVVDIALQAVGGELVGKPNDLGDGVNKQRLRVRRRTSRTSRLPHSGSITKDAPPAKSPQALLTGGSSSSSGGGFPTGQVSLVGLGALALVAGAALARKTRITSPATA